MLPDKAQEKGIPGRCIDLAWQGRRQSTSALQHGRERGTVCQQCAVNVSCTAAAAAFRQWWTGAKLPF